jgi:flagellar hook-associated protein 2
VTLDLKKAETGTLITVDVNRDYDAVKEKINEFVEGYNGVMGAINAQMSYDEEEGTGGPLFGDSSLRTLRSQLTNIVINKVSGVDEDFATLGLIGVNLEEGSILSVDDSTLQDYLESNFEDVRDLFAMSWTSTNSHINYVYHDEDTVAGTYSLYLDTGGSPDDYFMNGSGEKTEATVNGEYIDGGEGDANTLRVRYTGSDTGNVGSITLVYGVAELFERALSGLTDSYEGTIAQKDESIQDTIDRLDERLLEMEERIEKKMATMTSQFIAMETAMSQLQSQSEWLANQLSALG